MQGTGQLMARINYTNKTFTSAHQLIIDHAEVICQEYAQQGLSLTLRQIYYQFVARGLIANQQSEYKRLGGILSDARMAGQLDWNYMVDRTRNIVNWSTWDSPAKMLEKAAEDYATDLWAAQKKRVLVFVEKDAAIGVIEPTCYANQVSYFSCRGYTSVSEIHAMADRVRYFIEEGEQVTILHIGDHDPSGLDMSRDIEERLRVFITHDWLHTWGSEYGLWGSVTRGQIRTAMRRQLHDRGSHIPDDQLPWRLKRIALNFDQVEQYDPPPNPAKTTDARYHTYVATTGLHDSWELDALDPIVLQDLIQNEIDALRDIGVWGISELAMEQDRAVMKSLSTQWETVKPQFMPQEGTPQ